MAILFTSWHGSSLPEQIYNAFGRQQDNAKRVDTEFLFVSRAQFTA